MPARSKKQFRLFKAAEHNPELRKKLGMSKETAEEYTKENVGKKRYKKLKEMIRKK